MKVNKRNIINFYELSEEWQKEALSNLDELAEESFFLEPCNDSNPVEHVLWDLTEAMPVNGIIDGFIYNASIGISNNSAMLLNISDNIDEASFIFV